MSNFNIFLIYVKKFNVISGHYTRNVIVSCYKFEFSFYYLPGNV